MKKIFPIILLLTVFIFCACNTGGDEEVAVQPVTPQASAPTPVPKADSDNFVEEFDTEYKFGPANVVCYLPEGFKPSGEYEGEYFPEKKGDMSTINQIIYDSDEDLTQKTKEEYKEMVEAEFYDAYGEEMNINITQYDKLMLDGRPGLCIMYNYDFRGERYDLLVYIFYNGTENNIITFVQAPGADWMEEFIECGKTLRFDDSLEETVTENEE